MEVFVGLTPEEAKVVGNWHSSQCQSKPVNFQDQVQQVRCIFLRDDIGDRWKETATIVLSHLQQKLFKALMGLTSDKVLQYLRRIEIPGDVAVMTDKINLEKKKES